MLPVNPPRRDPHENRDDHRSPAAKWLPAVAAAGLLAVVIVAGVALGGPDDGGSALPPVDEAGVASVESVPAIETVATSTPVVESQLDRTLTNGASGDDVVQVQQRLTDLGFWPGPVDGVYGDQTIKSVWAYEKLVLGTPSDAPTGEVTPEMWDAMQDPFAVAPRRTTSTPTHVEVYLPEQVVAIFEDNIAVMISHASSGSNEDWCEEVTISPGEYGNEQGTEPLKRGECGKSFTPGGVFSVDRKVDGVRQSALGGMYDPVYFNYGIAIHGAYNVPLHPASHGCIRIPLALSPAMNDMLDIGDQVFVFDGVEEPEVYGEQPPYFNRIDPTYTTTTSSTTTTTSTTLAPPTTVAPTTIAPPAATSTAPTTVAATTAVPTTGPPVAETTTVPP
jgi:L,D-transpeptidase catalytic domain/Putative peptidoglycan binding domain